MDKWAKELRERMNPSRRYRYGLTAPKGDGHRLPVCPVPFSHDPRNASGSYPYGTVDYARPLSREELARFKLVALGRR